MENLYNSDRVLAIRDNDMQRPAAGLLLFGTETAWAQGITNPVGGGTIPVAFHFLIGLA